MLREDLLALRGARRIHGEWKFRRLQIAEKRGEARAAGRIELGGAFDDGEHGEEEFVVEVVAAAIPVQPQAVARFQIPERRIVRGADGAVVGQPEDVDLETIEGVGAAAARHGARGLPGEGAPLLADLEAQAGNQQPVEQPLGRRKRRDSFDAWQQFGHAPARVGGAGEDEVVEGIEIELVRGRAEDEPRFFVGRGADGAAVAERAVGDEAGKTDGDFGKADRVILPGSVTRPNAAQPPGPGSLSANNSGSTGQR